MDEIMVSVVCYVYNHSKYLRECLEGFIMQKTEYRFEVIVHDDASTDDSACIIKEYENKYPEIIKPIYQVKNQYSQGISIMKEHIIPKIQGKYMAWCEGDDCWIDERKLQRQIDFLEKNREYSCCLHNVFFEKVGEGSSYSIPGIKRPRDYLTDEIIKQGVFLQISSLVFRTSLYFLKPSCFFVKGFGDWPTFIYGSVCGKLHVLPEVMSKYRNGTEGSWTSRIRTDKALSINHQLVIINMLKAIDNYYPNQFKESIEYAVSRAEYNILKLNKDFKHMKEKKYRVFYKMDKRKRIIVIIKRRFPFLISLIHHLKRLIWKNNFFLEQS